MLILITGASGSGTSTLGAALAKELGIAHLDADDYYWIPTVPPFTTKRDRAERLSSVLRDVRAKQSAVLAGSIMEWGAELENAFDLNVFLYVDAAIFVRIPVLLWGSLFRGFLHNSLFAIGSSRISRIPLTVSEVAFFAMA